MPKVQVYLNPEAYRVLVNYRDSEKHPNLDEATNAILVDCNEIMQSLPAILEDQKIALEWQKLTNSREPFVYLSALWKEISDLRNGVST